MIFQVIPLIFKLKIILEKAQVDHEKHMTVRVASASAIGVLDKYVSMIECSDMYTVAMCKSNLRNILDLH